MLARLHRAFFALSLITAPLIASGALAQSSGFSGLNGDWRGGGTMQHDNGVTERIRCEATYRVSSPERLRQTLRCRSDQSQFSLATNLSLNGGDIVGDWSEATRNARGSLRGRFSPGVIQGLVDGPGFSANVSIRFFGNQQNVAIKSAGTEITTLNMVLTRAGR
jgi:hypothetical protein